ncbi:MFS transporter [Candidiatus Paracoxiella cheracis]|uniref:MFS transporter n=1 Tax=Candidiatus Paracoxiella cheracis TaxID=3405120 RepID=UPI003BF576B9
MQRLATDLENSIELTKPVANSHSLLRAWVVCLFASLFFFYEFIQLNMFNAISSQLMQTFHIDATELGRLSSFYFISNVAFLFVAGMLLDRFSTRKIILTALGICIVGTALFSTTTSILWASVFRFMTGIGSAFCFLSVIRLSTRWFPAKHLALVTGVIVTMAMIGGMVAQTPLALLAQAVEWRNALLIDACFGVIIFAIIWFGVKDYPSSHKKQHALEQQHIHDMGYWKSLGLAFLKIHNWLGGIYTCLMNLPIGLLGSIWGVLFLMDTHGMSKVAASYITSMLFFGTIIGGPFVGWLSDKMGRRKIPMIIGSVMSLGLILVVMLAPHLAFYTLMLMFLLLGITTSTQIIGYPVVAENSIPAITAMSVSVVNITTMGGYAVFQPFFGRLMDLHARNLHHTVGVYTASDFNWAMLIFPIGFVVALLASFCLRETHCQSREEPATIQTAQNKDVECTLGS